jgi:hypothetical protein
MRRAIRAFAVMSRHLVSRSPPTGEACTSGQPPPARGDGPRIATGRPVVAHTTFRVCLALSAQATPPASEQAQIEQIRQRIEALEQRMLDELAALRTELAARESATAATPAAQAIAPRAAVTGAGQGDTFSRDRESVARIDNVPTDVGPQGFVAIPGTPARAKLDGYAKLDTIVDAKPAGNTDQFVPSTIPIGLPDALQTASTTMHIRQTRLNLDFRSPTEIGEFRSFVELDFFGSSGRSIRGCAISTVRSPTC